MKTLKYFAKLVLAVAATLVIAVGLGAYVGLAVTSFKVGWGLGYFPTVGTHDTDRN
jgi:hypothetical protein